MALAKLTGVENDIRTIEKELRTEITRRNLGPEDLAKMLGIYTSGAMALLSQDMWSLETVLRLASLLKMEVRVTIGKRA